MIGKANTDKTVWHGDGYRVFVTLAGGIGIEISGHVVVKSAEMWHRAGAEHHHPSAGDRRIGDEYVIVPRKATHEILSAGYYAPVRDMFPESNNAVRMEGEIRPIWDAMIWEAEKVAKAALESLPAAAPAVAPASGVGGIDPRAIDALTNHQRQLDLEGVEVGVSRQALVEVLAALSAPSDAHVCPGYPCPDCHPDAWAYDDVGEADAQPAQAVTDELIMCLVEIRDADWPDHETGTGVERIQRLAERVLAERARSSQPPTAAQPAAVPAECVVVPREPTVVQVNAGVDADDMRTGFETVKHIYRTMIAAAPPPPTSAESRGEG